ncbi:MAG TPA: hypothetical protein VGR05_06700 [Sphingomicrobium sp.]|nr:hypothetical protein [Sphingomicrobium sp.]
MKHAFLAVALALSACASALSSGYPVRTDGLATLGQPTRVGALVVTPQALVEDSRCPINVRCVWAGRLVLKTRIDGAGWRETVDLILGEPHSTHGAGLALVSAEPGKIAGAEPSPPASLFGFEPR